MRSVRSHGPHRPLPRSRSVDLTVPIPGHGGGDPWARALRWFARRTAIGSLRYGDRYLSCSSRVDPGRLSGARHGPAIHIRVPWDLPRKVPMDAHRGTHLWIEGLCDPTRAIPRSTLHDPAIQPARLCDPTRAIPRSTLHDRAIHLARLCDPARTTLRSSPHDPAIQPARPCDPARTTLRSPDRASAIRRRQSRSPPKAQPGIDEPGPAIGPVADPTPGSGTSRTRSRDRPNTRKNSCVRLEPGVADDRPNRSMS
jgi:hypothetical protein